MIDKLPVVLKDCLQYSDYSQIKGIEQAKLARDAGIGLINLFPVIGGFAHSLIQSGISYSDSRLFRNCIRFIYGIKETTLKEREKFIEEVEEKSCDNAGNVICDILNRIDNINKAQVIANLMKARINNDIDIEDFFRLSAICDRIPYTDFKFLSSFVEDNFIDGGVTELLYSAGVLLLKSVGNDQVNKYTLSVTGRKLLKFGLNIEVDTNIENKTDVISDLAWEEINPDNLNSDQAQFEYDLLRGK